MPLSGQLTHDETAQLLDVVSQSNPQLGTLVDLLNGPSQEQICPQSTQAPGVGGG